MKVTTEHLKIGLEVFVINEHEMGSETYYNINREIIQAISIGKFLVYWFESGSECDHKNVFENIDQAKSILFKKIECNL